MLLISFYRLLFLIKCGGMRKVVKAMAGYPCKARWVVSSTWVTFRVVEIKVILGEGLQAALVVSESMTTASPGGHNSICSHIGPLLVLQATSAKHHQ